MEMVDQGAVKKCRKSEQSDTRTTEILKSEHAYADAHDRNVDLACRMANVTVVHQMGSVDDKRRSGAMIL
jgi:hypothetical protein